MDAATLAVLATSHNPWRARMWRSTAFSTTNSAFTTNIPYDNTDYDPNSNCTTGTGDAYYTCPVDGYYSVNALLNAAATGAGQFLALELFNSPASGGGFAAVQYGPYTNSEAAQEIGAALVVMSTPCFAGDQLAIRWYTGTAMVAQVGKTTMYAEFAFVAPR